MTLPTRMGIALVSLVLSLACGCGSSAEPSLMDAEEARRDLESRQIAVTEDELRRRYTSGDTETVGRLLAAGVDPNARGPGGTTALMFATDASAVAQLLSAGADPDAAGLSGITPLMNAISLGDREIVEALLEAGASPDLADEVGRTPMLLATSMGLPDIVDRLRGHGAAPLHRAVIETEVLERYAGTYESMSSTVLVAYDRGQLFLVALAGATGLYEVELIPLDESTFYRHRDPAALLFRFERTDDGRIAGLRSLLGGGWFARVAPAEQTQ